MKAVFLAGVTGSGKTDIALNLSKHYKIHLISCDSVQIYNRLSILSNKPTEINSHIMLDFYDFTSQYDVIKYVEDVKREIELCKATNSIPVIVGGTGFYFSKLILGNFDILRIFLTQKRETLYERLNDRCEKMVMSGMLEEVRSANNDGLTDEHILGKSIGCRDGLIFLKELKVKPEKGFENFEKFLLNFKRRSRNYARKQECWFRSTDFIWVDIDLYDAAGIINNFLNDKSNCDDLEAINTKSRSVNANARKRMKTYVTPESKIPRDVLDNIISAVVNQVKESK